MTKYIYILITLIAALLLFNDDVGVLFSVNPASEAIITQNGKIVGSPKKPGLHFKIPFMQKVHEVRVKVVRKNLIDIGDKNLTAHILWNVSDSEKFFTSKQNEDINNKIRDLSKPLLDKAVANYTLQHFQLVSEKQENDPEYIDPKAQKVLGEIQDSISKYGVNVFRVLYRKAA